MTPAGRFFPSDGRELNVPGWYIDADIAQRVIERFNARQTPLVLDYEHQTLNKDENGQPAPAAGWWKSLEWRDGSGLWAKCHGRWLDKRPFVPRTVACQIPSQTHRHMEKLQ